ncbi:MAG TPA: BlaI/MecI/CopY family transcriptional regulator [Flavobacteriaceae bacterium]|nr:BlaI/MecI/CopY family transcriptional regulator [Flavobacteriaceae bacterium]
MRELTKAEEEIMQVLWELEEANVASIIEQLPNPKPAYNTVSTIVRILESKGFVDFRKKGRGHIYFPIVEKSEYSNQYLNKFLSGYFQGSFKSMVSFFVKKNDLSMQEMEEILKIIDKEKTEK